MKTKLSAVIFSIAVLLAVMMPTMWVAADDTVGAAVITEAGRREFKSVKEALNAAVKQNDTGATVTLTSDWNVGADGVPEKGYTLSNGAKLTVDLNGYKIDSTGRKGRLFYLSENATLTIRDSRKDVTSYSSAIQGGVVVGCTYDDEGGAVYVEENATLTMTGGSFVGCVSDDDGGAIYAEENAKVTLNGTGFYTCRSYESKGGALVSDDGKITLTNCVFEGNTCDENGGALYLNSDAAAKITGCRFTYNAATGNGGAIYANGNGGTTLKDNIIRENTAKGDGGGLYVYGDRVYLFSNRITDNTASDKGGGVYVDSLYDINCCEQLVIENNTDREGKSDLCLQSGVFSTAYMNCGGLTEGAKVGIDIAGDSESVICREISLFQYQNYLFSDRGKLVFSKEKVVAENFVSSAIGSGSVRVILIGAVGLMLLSIILPLAIRKKKKGEDDDETA